MSLCMYSIILNVCLNVIIISVCKLVTECATLSLIMNVCLYTLLNVRLNNRYRMRVSALDIECVSLA
jgi:hypothetical protein